MTRLLLATDGLGGSYAAARFAAAMARDRGCAVEVVSVLEPMPLSVGAFATTLPHAADVNRLRRAELLSRVDQLVAAAFPVGARAPIRAAEGPVGATVAEAAREMGADLIVLGRRSRGGRERVVLSTAVEVLALAGVPVLSVVPSPSALPRHALAAIDFGEASARAAGSALELLDRPGRLSLLHVIPPLNFPAALLWGWDESWAGRVPEEFRRLRTTLGAKDEDVEVTTHVARSDPASALLRRAEEDGVDLIAAGSQGSTLRDRVFTGSVATRLLSEAPCSVLLHPAVPAASAPVARAGGSLGRAGYAAHG